MFVLQEPLNSGDDVSDEEDQELFDTENVVVCQYDKVLLTHTHGGVADEYTLALTCRSSGMYHASAGMTKSIS